MLAAWSFFIMRCSYKYLLFVNLKLMGSNALLTIINNNSMKKQLLFLLLLASVWSATQIANYPLITNMKSGDHKLLTASQQGVFSLVFGQSYFQAFSNLPEVAIGIRDFQTLNAQTNSSATSNEINYKCEIISSDITTTYFRTTLTLTSTNTFSLLYYMYIAIDVIQFANTYLYAYSIDTSSMFNDTSGVMDISSYNISETISDFSNAVVVPIVMSFHISTSHEYSFYTQASMSSSSTFDLNITSNSNLQRIEMTVFIIDKTKMQENYIFYIDTGRLVVQNNNGTPTSTFAPPSFNYFNYILGMTAFRVNSSFSPNFYLTPSNTIGTVTQYILVRYSALHWRKRQCLSSPTIGKFVVEEQLCYDSCPNGYATDSSIDYCVICSYTCSTCQVDGTSCSSCPINSNRTLNNASFQCACDTGYFDNGTVLCASCDYTCLTCASIESNCTSCDATRNLTGNSCPCLTGFYDTNTSNHTCATCDVTCLTCSGSATTCTSCDETNNHRILIASTSKCLCKSGFQDTGVAICSVSSITCTSPCLTCENTSTTCTSCSSTNNPSDRILSGNSCACPTFYTAISSTAPCTQICGNSNMPSSTSKQCDDGNTLDGDGCSSTCTKESGFTCDNTQSPSVCTSDGGYVVSSQTVTKDQKSNTVTVALNLDPVPPPSSVPSLSNLLDSLSLQSYSWNRGALTMQLNLLKAVSSSDLLNIRLSVINASTALPLVDSNNAQLIPYAQTYYSIYDVQTGLIWFYIAALWVVALYRLITEPKLISQVTEMFVFSSLAWIGVEGQKYESGPLIPIQNLRYMYGYNITLSDNSLFSVFNISFAYLFLPLILFTILLCISKTKPGLIPSRTKRFILYDISYAWLMVNGFLITFGISKAISEQTGFTGVTAAGIVVGVLYLVVMSIISYRSFFRGENPEEVGGILEYTKKNLFKHKPYPVLWLCTLVICFIYLSIKNTTKVNPMLMEGWFLAMFLVLGVGGIYINKMRYLLNLITLAFIYGLILLINNVEESAWIGMVIVGLLFTGLVTNFVIMHFQKNNLRVDDDDLLEDRAKKDDKPLDIEDLENTNRNVNNESKLPDIEEVINQRDETRRELMELGNHTGLFTIYQPKNDLDMMVPRPPQNQDNILQSVMKNQEEQIIDGSHIKAQLNQFLLTSPKHRKGQTEAKKEQFIDLENANIDQL